MRYCSETTRIRYAFSSLSGATLNHVHSEEDESTANIHFNGLNELLKILKQAYDNPERVYAAAHEISGPCQKN
jgi:hypothetical protein